MIEAIVFDFDGVLVDSEPLHYRAFLTAAGSFDLAYDYPTYLDRYVGYDDRQGFEAMLRDAGYDQAADDAPGIAELIRKKADDFERLAAEETEPMPGAVELVRAVADRWPLAIASGATQQDIAVMLDQIGLADAFGVIVAADDVARSKPDPQTYRKAVEQLSVTPGAAVAIEDTPDGISSAKKAGLRTVAVASTMGADQLEEAERLVDDLTELSPDKLEAWFGGDSDNG
ncbi:MAG: HAD family phosphatase [Phycisphaeraceae bacterium]|nr:HAD family phosphatase [Phycisphaeraceae bacterium]